MSSVYILQLCFINALFLHACHPLNINKAITARRSRSHAAPSAWKHRHRRTHSVPANPHRRRRSSSLVYCPDFLRKTSRSFALHKLASEKHNHEAPHDHNCDRPSRVEREPGSMEHMIALQHSLDQVMLQPALEPETTQNQYHDLDSSYISEDASSPPPHSETRSTRSMSSASRNTNRLSLTLPIAPPNPNPSRPTPLSTTSSSFPPTPMDTPSVMSPTDPSDWITAIAAQERRVLEIREELSRAEFELKTLKKQWQSHEAARKRAERRYPEPLRPIAPLIDLSDDTPSRQSIEIDRKKALLLGQQGQQHDGLERGRRRVFTGSHTRALSLLSPKKLADGFAVHEDGLDSQLSKGSEPSTPQVGRRAPITPAQLAKRASWTPRSIHQQATGMKQIAEDFKSGLWTFVEDLRQATVGDEPITGHKPQTRGADGSARSTLAASANLDQSQDTIRASATNTRPRVQSAFDETPSKPATRMEDVAKLEGPRNRQGLPGSKTEVSKPSKRFSWTPLTADALDDEDWSSWDSPAVKSPRWSGSTMNGDIETIPEKRDENDTPLRKKASNTQMPTSSPLGASNKLEELLPPVLNRLTPSNLKREMTEFMEEWERSLSPPETSAVTPSS